MDDVKELITVLLETFGSFTNDAQVQSLLLVRTDQDQTQEIWKTSPTNDAQGLQVAQHLEAEAD